MTKKQAHITKENLQRYLNNEMDGRERNEFERLLQKKPFEAEALEGIEQIGSKQFQDDINELQEKIKPKKKKSNLPYRIAAIALLLISTSIVLIQINKEKPNNKVVLNQEEPNKKEATKEPTTTTKEEDVVEIPEEIAEEGLLVTEKTLQKGQPIIETTPKPETLTQQPVGEKQTETIPLSDKAREIQIPISVDKKGKTEKAEKKLPIEPNKISQEKLTKAVFDASGTSRALTKQTSLDIREDTNLYNLVRGKVVFAEDKQPIPGATIFVKGTQLGTTTDLEGNFNFEVPKNTSNTFVASFVGMESTEFKPTQPDNIIALEPLNVGLEEVVVVGYESQRKQKLTGSVARVKKGNSKAKPTIGFEAYNKYLKENAVYETSLDINKNVVRVKLIINANGEITAITPINNPDTTLLQKTIRLIQDGPVWAPMVKDGMDIESEATIKIKFKLKNE